MRHFIWIVRIIGYILCGLAGVLASQGEWVFCIGFFLTGMGLTTLAGYIAYLEDIYDSIWDTIKKLWKIE